MAVPLGQFLTARGRSRRNRGTALEAACILGLAIVGGGLVRRAIPSGDAVEPLLVVYQAAIVWIAVLLAMRVRPTATVVVADLVVQLGKSPSGALQDALAATLGDPTLRVGYWSDAGVYVEASGGPMEVEQLGRDRATTFVERDAEPFVVLVHDPAVLDEPALVEAVRRGPCDSDLLEASPR